MYDFPLLMNIKKIYLIIRLVKRIQIIIIIKHERIQFNTIKLPISQELQEVNNKTTHNVCSYSRNFKENIMK